MPRNYYVSDNMTFAGGAKVTNLGKRELLFLLHTWGSSEFSKGREEEVRIELPTNQKQRERFLNDLEEAIREIRAGSIEERAATHKIQLAKNGNDIKGRGEP